MVSVIAESYSDIITLEVRGAVLQLNAREAELVVKQLSGVLDWRMEVRTTQSKVERAYALPALLERGDCDA